MIILTMPVYNEADGIEEFINELDRALPAGVLLQVVDDASSDSTLARLESVDLPLGRLRILQNSANVGHGPTTLRGLREALINDVDVVASIDGDGQFDAADVAGLLERLDEEWDVLEGCRFGRTDPWFRKVTSKVTAFLVALRCGRLSTDTNTPLRIYRREVLEALLDGIPENCGAKSVDFRAEQATRAACDRGTGSVSRATRRSGDGHNVGIATGLDTHRAVRPVPLACLPAVLDGFCILTGHNPLSATYYKGRAVGPCGCRCASGTTICLSTLFCTTQRSI